MRRPSAVELLQCIGTWIITLSLTVTAEAQTTLVNPLSAKSQETFYHLPEGGGVLPMILYRQLEVIDAQTGQETGQTFAERMPHYGFLTDEAADLPVGFSVVPLDFVGGLKALSLNCAACHVGELHVTRNGTFTKLRIIGGPNMADFRQFSLDVQASLLRLVTSPPRLLYQLVQSRRLQPETVVWLERQGFIPGDRFEMEARSSDAKTLVASFEETTQRWRRDHRRHELLSSKISDAVLPRFGDASQVAMLDLFRNLQLLIAEAEYFLAQGRYPLTTREGYGRLDAFGTVRYLLFPEQSAELPFTGPASVPHLWGTGRKKWLHWGNNTNSTLQRNMAQSLGTGALQVVSGTNNILLPNLAELETVVQQISSPAWPVAVLGELNADLVAHGKSLYVSRCASCHDAGTVDTTTGLIEYPLFSLAEAGTDPQYALNFHQPVGSKSFAESMGARLTTLENWYYYRRDPQHPVSLWTQLAWNGGLSRVPTVWRDRLQIDANAPAYAALPLNGVWATAPYLHNASVPTLRDLLRPASQRPQVFMVGPRDFDAVNVGYTSPADPTTIPAIYRFDTREVGNSNRGHEGPAFGAEGLSAADVEALLEYLKSL